MNFRSQDERVAQVLAGFTGDHENETPPPSVAVEQWRGGCGCSNGVGCGCGGGSSLRTTCGSDGDPSYSEEEDDDDDDDDDHDIVDVRGCPTFDTIPVPKTFIARPPPIMISDAFRPAHSPELLWAGLGPPIGVIQFGLSCAPDFSKYTDWQYRRVSIGRNKCKGNNKVALIREAYAEAYLRVRAAELEFNRWAEYAESQAHLAEPLRNALKSSCWKADSQGFSTSFQTLAYWFGLPESPYLNLRFETLHQSLKLWSYRFRNGFRKNGKPVRINCGPWGYQDRPAWHISKNTIKLFPIWFGLSKGKRIATMIHEMCHHAFGSVVHPRDEHDSVCTGGADIFGNEIDTCYRGSLFNDEWYIGGNPRSLAEKFDSNGTTDTRTKMMNNIDNFVCYVVNRWHNRGLCMLSPELTVQAPVLTLP
jgi:hypothetical protein